MISLFGAFVFQSTLPARGATNCTAPGLPRGGTFQSTLPARGATGCAPAERRNKSISLHAPRTGSDLAISSFGGANLISIHAPRTGSDSITVTIAVEIHISIHAPRTGSDPAAAPAAGGRRFQSTLPARGATRRTATHKRRRERFQSTLPARGATLLNPINIAKQVFQSTLPARGATFPSTS